MHVKILYARHHPCARNDSFAVSYVSFTEIKGYFHLGQSKWYYYYSHVHLGVQTGRIGQGGRVKCRIPFYIPKSYSPVSWGGGVVQ